MKALAAGAFVVLLVLLLVRFPSLKRTSARPAWLATFFGCFAIISIGAVLPLDAVDSPLGGTNIVNLVQSYLTIAAFWFFRDAVSVFYRGRRLHSPWLLLPALVATTIPFLFIEDRGPTSNTFMADHVDQLANVIYNSVYMALVAAIVLDLIRLLRHPADRVQWVFFLGLFPIPAACVTEIAYVVSAHLLPAWRGAQLLADMFYVLFYAGVTVVAIAWTTALIRERGLIDRFLWRYRSARVALMIERSPRIAYRTFRSDRPADLGYGLAVQIRNHVIHTQLPLTRRQERIVSRLEARFLSPAATTSTATLP